MFTHYIILYVNISLYQCINLDMNFNSTFVMAKCWHISNRFNANTWHYKEGSPHFYAFAGVISWILLLCSSSFIIVLISLKLSSLNINFMLILWGVAFMGFLFLAQEEPIFAFNSETQSDTLFTEEAHFYYF